MKTYLISGATSGIGRAVAEHLNELGHRVIGLRRVSSEKAPWLDKEIYVDLKKPEQVEEVLSSFNDRIDAFINCAGLLPGNNFMESDSKQLSELFNINIISPMVVVKHIVPFLNDGGVIVLFGSVSAQKGSYDDGYAASKGAVQSLVKSLSTKLAPKHRIICIAPGMTIPTRMTDELLPGRFEHNLKTIPMNQPTKASHIAEIIEFLISPSCENMTGCTIDINGGQYLR